MAKRPESPLVKPPEQPNVQQPPPPEINTPPAPPEVKVEPTQSEVNFARIDVPLGNPGYAMHSLRKLDHKHAITLARVLAGMQADKRKLASGRNVQNHDDALAMMLEDVEKVSLK